MRGLILICVAVGWLAQCTSAPVSPTARPTRVPISERDAVRYALESQNADSPVGHLVGTPDRIYGELTTLDHAFTRVNGTPLLAGSQMYRQRERRVWLIVTRGAWLLHIPGAHGDPAQGTPTIMSKDIAVQDLWNATILDAAGGDTILSTGVHASRLADIQTMPALLNPADTGASQATPTVATPP